MSDVKEIPGFPGYYASHSGKIWSNKRRKIKILKMYRKHGTWQVGLWREGRQYWVTVPRLIMMTFAGPRPIGPDGHGYVITHINGDSSDISFQNLKYIPRYELHRKAA